VAVNSSVNSSLGHPIGEGESCGVGICVVCDADCRGKRASVGASEVVLLGSTLKGVWVTGSKGGIGEGEEGRDEQGRSRRSLGKHGR
jgi:hypothetical protein